jgi:hypothetical protein
VWTTNRRIRIRQIVSEKRARTDYFGAFGPSASLTLGSPCGRSTWPAAKLSNRLVVCREFELKTSSSSWPLSGTQFRKSVARPERLFAAAPRILRYAPDRRRALRGSVQLGRRRPSCRTPLFVCRRFELSPTNISTNRSFFGIQKFWRARTDSNRRPPGSKLEGTEKLEILVFGSHWFLTTTLAGCPLQIHPRARQSTTESRKSPATTWLLWIGPTTYLNYYRAGLWTAN